MIFKGVDFGRFQIKSGAKGVKSGANGFKSGANAVQPKKCTAFDFEILNPSHHCLTRLYLMGPAQLG